MRVAQYRTNFHLGPVALPMDVCTWLSVEKSPGEDAASLHDIEMEATCEIIATLVLVIADADRDGWAPDSGENAGITIFTSNRPVLAQIVLVQERRNFPDEQGANAKTVRRID